MKYEQARNLITECEGKTIEKIKWDSVNMMEIYFTDGTSFKLMGEGNYIGSGLYLPEIVLYEY